MTFRDSVLNLFPAVLSGVSEASKLLFAVKNVAKFFLQKDGNRSAVLRDNTYEQVVYGSLVGVSTSRHTGLVWRAGTVKGWIILLRWTNLFVSNYSDHWQTNGMESSQLISDVAVGFQLYTLALPHQQNVWLSDNIKIIYQVTRAGSSFVLIITAGSPTSVLSYGDIFVDSSLQFC